MPRLRISARDDAPAASKPILDSVYRTLGVVPDEARLLGSSRAALEAFAALQAGLSKALDVKTRERIAIAVAQVNGCDYCLSAHSYIATNFAKLAPEEIALNRRGASKDPRADAAVNFAAKVAEHRGRVSDEDIAAVKRAGFDDAEIVEIVAVMAQNSFTNLLNTVAKTEIDFPVVRANYAADSDEQQPPAQP